MSNRYWKGEWPNLSSISIVIDDESLSAAELGALYRLTWFIAGRCVHSAYSDPTPDPGLPDDDQVIARIARCSKSEWSKVRNAVLSHFVLRDGKWRLRDFETIRLTRETSRAALSTEVKSTAVRRDAGRCVYCGDEAGPFHFDHLWPVAKGGGDEPNNIVLACAPCNRSKRDMTLLEWVEKGRSGNGADS